MRRAGAAVALVASLVGLAAGLARSAEPRDPVVGWRLHVQRPGLYAVRLDDVPGRAECVAPGANLDDARFVLTSEGQPVPFAYVADRQSIVFWGEPGRDLRDWRGRCYRLRFAGEGERPLRWDAATIAAPASAVNGLARFAARALGGVGYDPLPTPDPAALSPVAKRGGYWLHGATAPPPRRPGPIELAFLVGTDETPRSFDRVRLNLSGIFVERVHVEELPGGRRHSSLAIATGRAAGKLRIRAGAFTTEVELGRAPPEGDSATVALPADVVKDGRASVTLEAVPPGVVLVQSAVIEADAPVGAAAKLAPADGYVFEALGPVQFTGHRPGGMVVVDLTAGAACSVSPEGGVATAAGHAIGVFDYGNLRAPDAIEPCYAPSLDEGGADWLAIVPRRARRVLAPLVAHRKAQGLAARVVSVEEVLDGFGDGTYSGEAVQRFLAHARERWRPAPRFVLLAGDAFRDVRPNLPGLWVPTLLADTHDNGASATDGLMAPRGMAIGRMPCRTEEELASFVAKTIAYENAPTDPAQRQLAFVCGEGRFGPMVDQAIENLFTAAVSKRVPEAYDVDVTYANPTSAFLYPPDEFSDRVVQRLSDGPLIFDYVGHGQTSSFDDVTWGKKRFPILRVKDAEAVRCEPGRNPIVLVTACWTGCFDQPATAVGEALALNPRGAVAVIAASRISHPLSNALLSLELVERLFAEPESERPRLGTILRAALDELTLRSGAAEGKTVTSFGRMMLNGDERLLERLIEDERRLYNLLGDPALRPRFPRVAELEGAPSDATLGSLLVFSVPGAVAATLERPRGIPRGLTGLPQETKPDAILDPDVRARVLETYRKANDAVLSRARIEEGQLLLEVPPDLKPGSYVLKVWQRDGVALSSRIDVDEGEPVRPEPRPRKKKWY